MTPNAWLQLALFVAALVALAKPLGGYVADVYEGRARRAERVLGPVERLIYRAAGVHPEVEMDSGGYALAMLVFNATGVLVVYGLQRAQALLPLNPQGFAAPSPDLAFNTAVSFATNTNWQAYGGESTFGYAVSLLGFTVQNFVSAASGMAVLAALLRGMGRASSPTIGNFWVDLVRSTLYVLVPLSLVLAVFLVSQGVVQTFAAYPSAHALQGGAEQVLAVGPAASQIAIKQLGTNGGGFFNANSAHPFENPTPLGNFVECLAILALPAALCHAFGRMVKDPRQGWAIFAAMAVIFVPLLVACVWLEQQPHPGLASLGIDQAASALAPGGNMEGKEARFGVTDTALWAVATSAASNGSVNGMHDSFSPLGGLVPMWLIQLGEIVFGGVGSGLYGMLAFAIVAVFVSGLMVGRTPEYLGKKIEAYEMKMASLVVLVPALTVLVGTAVAVATTAGRAGPLNPGPHGFSEILYAFSSAGNNNGSAFGGLSANTPFYNVALGVAMFLGRYLVAIPVLAIAGSLAKKKRVPAGAGTLPTHTPLFVGMLVAVVVVVGALTFMPALALGPVVEQLILRHGA